MAREFGAGKFGQSLAALCALAAPVFLGVNSLLTMDSFEQLFWALALCLLVRIFRDGRARLWAGGGIAPAFLLPYIAWNAVHDLPPVVSGHNACFIWSPGECTGEVILYYGYGTEWELRSSFESVEWLGLTHCQYCIPYENNRSIYLGRGIRRPLEEIWAGLKEFIKTPLVRKNIIHATTSET